MFGKNMDISFFFATVKVKMQVFPHNILLKFWSLSTQSAQDSNHTRSAPTHEKDKDFVDHTLYDSFDTIAAIQSFVQ